MDDKLCIFTSNGEVAIYTGLDPAASDFGLIGVFKHDAPMSRYCCQNYGGDLWTLTSTGLAPLSTLVKSETEKINKAEKGVVSYFRDVSERFPTLPGWYVLLDNSTGRMLCNMPLGAPDHYRQMVRFMPDPVWASWENIRSRCWAWMDDHLYCGADGGGFYEISTFNRSDDLDPAVPTFLGTAIVAEYRGAWSAYKTPGVKHFKLVRVYAQTTGVAIKPFVDFDVNYGDRKPYNQPDAIQPAPGTPWGVPWGSPWSRGKQPMMTWGGVGRLGAVGAPRVAIKVLNATYEVSGFDVVFETGAI
jgi:hypothetical protein